VGKAQTVEPCAHFACGGVRPVYLDPDVNRVSLTPEWKKDILTYLLIRSSEQKAEKNVLKTKYLRKLVSPELEGKEE
jgi:hypothetical protein